MIKLHRHPPLCAAAAAFLAAASLGTAHASVVSPGDTFSIEAQGYNSVDPSGHYTIIAQALSPTFGVTETYANSALGDQTLTVTSSESTVGGVTTDTVSLSVPSNFIPAGYVDDNGNPINAIEFSIGVTKELGGTDPLDFSAPVNSYTPSGTVTFDATGVPMTDEIPSQYQAPTFTDDNTAYSDREAVIINNTQDPTDPAAQYSISNDDVTAISFSITNPVPESSTWAAMLVGAGLLGLTFRRRFRVA